MSQPVPPAPYQPGPQPQPPQFTAGPGPVPPPPAPAPVFTTPTPAPKKGKWFTSKPAIGIAALVLGLIIGSAGASGSAGAAGSAAPTVTVTGAAGATVTQQVTTTATVATTVTAQPAPPAGTFKDGTWLVGKDIKPGTYKTANTSGKCYWARLKDTEGTLDSILANNNLTGPGVVTIKSTDVAFESAYCGEWQPA